MSVERESSYPAHGCAGTVGGEAVPESSAQARARGWQGAAQKLRQQQDRLLALRDKGFNRVQRLMGRASTLMAPSVIGGMCGIFDMLPFTAENLLLGYAQGIYALDSNGQARWHCPPERFVLYLRELRLSQELRRDLLQLDYTVTFDRAPRQVLEACAAGSEQQTNTWLSGRFMDLYMELFDLGAMHTVEVWKDGVLVAGSFGVSIGRVWSSEGQFERAPLAGAALFAGAADHLLARGFELVDVQLYSEQLARFGAREVPIAEYRSALARGLVAPVSFHAPGPQPPVGSAATRS
jgi:leucyl/phenylalanyl-tRNA---protein transferase